MITIGRAQRSCRRRPRTADRAVSDGSAEKGQNLSDDTVRGRRLDARLSPSSWTFMRAWQRRCSSCSVAAVYATITPDPRP